MTHRILPLLAGALAVCLGLSGGAEAQAAASIKPFAKVKGSEIRLSHVVEGAGEAGNIIVQAAPAPGDDMTLSAAGVARLAEANGVALASASNITRIRVERPGLAVSRAEIAGLLLDALRAEGHDDDYEVSLSNSRLTVYLPLGSSLDDLTLSNLRFTDRTGRVSADLQVPLGDGRTDRVALSGLAERMQHIPVLAASMAPGDRIGREDLEWVRKPARRISRNVVRDMDGLLGMSLRRPVRPGQSLRSSDVEKPRLIERGQRVSMVIEHKRMTLTATGKALESGGRGDLIRLQNIATHRVVEAVVVSPNRVDIGHGERVQTARR